MRYFEELSRERGRLVGQARELLDSLKELNAKLQAEGLPVLLW
jgi:hypothetical protein